MKHINFFHNENSRKGREVLDGVLYLWFFWIVWVISTFLLPRTNPYRIHIALLSLLTIIIFPFTVKMGNVSFSLPLFLLVGCSFFLIRKYGLASKLYMLVGALIIGMVYASFYFFAIYDPVWIIIEEKFLLTSILLMFIFLLYSSSLQFMQRIHVLIQGTAIGEGLLTVEYQYIGFPKTVGDVAFLDTISLTIAIIYVIHLGYQLSSFFTVKFTTRKGATKNL